ncbi:membrane protein insertase YidC [Blastococcus saxobsidens]|uniref:Membrane protein insertase YidC n=1 Tax=Blastococcus saxobsidens (strain DD2) TaxID=1146883 RepID=H6RW18_BLASD|nr:membrane protein insertase YidC [Blastococcus saxobsidens]CCG05848.1 Preprotein translocase subunit YidC [Blastococcus saxobsidens DD2]
MFDPLYTAIAWVMARWHSLWNLVFGDPAPETALGGLSWVLAIVFLVITIRVILFPLFVKQIKSQRAMQQLQPELAKLRKQYGSDRQGMAVAMQQLQKERGVNPLAGCLPILPQIPVFFALFHVLRYIAPGAEAHYSLSAEQIAEAARAQLFGAPISSSFNMDGAKEQAILGIQGVTYTNIRIVAFALIVVMCFTTYFTQKQIMARSGPVEGQAAMVQKLMLYGIPISLFISGFIFPIGVLIYWMTNNLWTMGQQFFVLRKMPPPGSDAAKAKAAAEKPAIDPKTLAPKPGAKPVRPKQGRPVVDPEPVTDVTGSTVDGNGAGPASGGNGAGPASGGNGGSTRAGGGSRPGAGQGPANRGKRKRR